MRYFFVLLNCLFFFNTALAASYNSYYCENNFKSVSIGATQDAVRTACGTPTTITTRQLQISTPINTVKWIYTLGLMSVQGVTINLPSLAITFENHRVIEIEKNGFPISAGGYCSINGIVNLGDEDTTVLSLCGQPNVVTKLQQQQFSTKQIIEWTYDFGPYKPQIIFDFENGVLTQISSGQLGH